MTFLALGSWQALALGAAVAAAVTWLFFLKLRHPRVRVASLLLWRRAVEEHRPRALVERLRRWISLALALAIGLLLALAPARPATGGGAEEGVVLAVVVDTSPSMASRTADGLTRLDHARARAREVIVGAPPGVAVGLADTSGALQVVPGTPRTEVLRALDTLAPGPPGRRPLSFGRVEGRVVFVTDGVAPDSLPPTATRISVFEPTDNVGIDAFAIRPVPASPRTYQAYLEVVNRSPRSKTVVITIGNARATWLTRTVEIAAGGRDREVLDTAGFQDGEVRASVKADGDGFSLDDRAYAWLPSRAPVKTVLVTDGNRPLETLLALDAGVELTTLSPAQFQPRPGTDVYVFDRFAPTAAPAAPALVIHPPAVGWVSSLVQITGEVAGPAVTSWRPHPVLAYVSSVDLRIAHALKLQIAAGSEAAGVEAIASAADTPLVVTAVRPVKRLIVGFDLLDSDFPFQVGFPLFVQNALAWLAETRHPLEVAAGTVRVPWADAGISTPEGEPIAARQALDATVFDAARPGLYLAQRGDERLPVVVGLGDPEVSDVNRSTLAGAAGAPVSAPRGRELWVAMLLAAVGLVTVEWWTFHRRLTV